MASQLQAPTPFADGNQITAANLNAHVNGAILLPGAITEQDTATTLQQADTMLVQQSGLLREASVAQMKTAMGLGSYVARSGANNTGMVASAQLTLGTTAPLQPLHAVSLGHLTANYLKNSSDIQTLTGALKISNYLDIGTSQELRLTTSGIALLTTNQIATLGADPILPLQAATKQYVDNSLKVQQLKCKGSFTNANPLIALSGSPPAASKAKYLAIKITRTAGTAVATIDFSTLSNEYKSATSPFFLKGQYIGLQIDSGNLLGHLYKIESVDYTSSSLTITTPGYTTALSAKANNLTLLYDNAENNDADTFNCKSVYTDEESRKIYVNYWNDTIGGSKTNDSPTQFFNSIVNGQATAYYSGVLVTTLFNAAECAFVNGTDSVYSVGQNEGFGSFSTGIHMYFNYGSAGFAADNNAYMRASFAIF